MLAEVVDNNDYASCPRNPSSLMHRSETGWTRGGLSDFQEDEYDIPTFLRKQAD
jgi:hypothetical protein